MYLTILLNIEKKNYLIFILYYINDNLSISMTYIVDDDQ